MNVNECDWIWMHYVLIKQRKTCYIESLIVSTWFFDALWMNYVDVLIDVENMMVHVILKVIIKLMYYVLIYVENMMVYVILKVIIKLMYYVLIYVENMMVLLYWKPSIKTDMFTDFFYITVVFLIGYCISKFGSWEKVVMCVFILGILLPYLKSHSIYPNSNRFFLDFNLFHEKWKIP